MIVKNNNKFINEKHLKNIINNIKKYVRENVEIEKIELDTFARVIMSLNNQKYIYTFDYNIYEVALLTCNKLKEE